MLRKITPDEIPDLIKYIRDVSGIELDETKTYLMESRLSPLLERLGLNNYAELSRKARLDGSGEVKRHILDAITTNETSFFRDKRPFYLLEHKIIPDYFERKGNDAKLNIWSAASSTGQEIYSIAIIIKELFYDTSKLKVKILGTDISEDALKSSSMGRYSKLELSRGLTDKLLRKHFEPHGNSWQISDELRSMTQFKKLNLMEPLNGVGFFDIIFCRNVAIYFSLKNRKILFERIAARLNPKGVLIIGSTESLSGVTKVFAKQEFHGAFYYTVN